MDYSFFKEVTTNLSMTNNTKGPFVYSKGDRGLGVKQIQQNLLALGFSLPKFEADGFYGDELICCSEKIPESVWPFFRWDSRRHTAASC